MNAIPRAVFFPLLLLAVVSLAACTNTRFEPPQVQPWPTMVEVDGKPVMLVLAKQEEVREVRLGTGGRGRSSSTRTDTYYHFDLRAYDPATATPLWRRRLMTIGDPDAKTNISATRVIGSSASGRLLGQEGDRVWLQIADVPAAVSARDGTVVVTAEQLQAANPELAGKLPSEERHYSFDRGLVILAADARQWVIRGDDAKAEAYVPPPPAPEPPKPASLGNQQRLVVPLRPFGEAPARLVALDDRLVGLYSEKEAREAENDEFGDRLAYPYTILDEGSTARRQFWTVRTAEATKWDETWQRIEKLEPIAGTPTYLRGRFLKRLPGEEPLRAADPDGVYVWHSTRMDDAGRLALARLGTDLKPVWTAELPLSENDIANPVRYWLLGDRIFVMGGLRTEADYIVGSEQMLVSVGMADGQVVAHDLSREPTEVGDPEKVAPRDAGPAAAAP